jgi:hypothetical protein
MMDFVSTPLAAAALVTLYLALFGHQSWIAEFYETLEHSEMEFGDTADMTFISQAGKVTAVEHAPGSTDEADKIKLTVRY